MHTQWLTWPGGGGLPLGAGMTRLRPPKPQPP
jgi:hypothetical protein